MVEVTSLREDSKRINSVLLDLSARSLAPVKS